MGLRRTGAGVRVIPALIEASGMFLPKWVEWIILYPLFALSFLLIAFGLIVWCAYLGLKRWLAKDRAQEERWKDEA